MRQSIERLLRDATLVTLALALALGWTLVLFAQGVSETITTLFTHYSDSDLLDLSGGRPLTWAVGDRVLTLNALVSGLIALGVVVAVAMLIDRRSRTRPARHL
jgi:ABC-type arginine transport system permease subunit